MVYRRAISRVRSHVDPYVPSDGSPYKYSPGVLVPLQMLPTQDCDAWKLFKLFSVVLWATALIFGSTYRIWSDFWLLLVGILLSWKGLLETLDYGQIEFALLFVAVVSSRIATRARFFSSFLLGCLPWFKLPWLILGVPFFIVAFKNGKFELVKFLSGYLMGSIFFGFILPVSYFGYEGLSHLTVSWLSLLARQPSDLFMSDMNQSLWSTAYRLCVLNLWVGVPVLFFVGLLCFYCLTSIVGNFSKKLSFVQSFPLQWVSPWLLIILLFNPLSWRWGSLLVVGVPLVAMPNYLRLPRKKLYGIFYWAGLVSVGLLWLLSQNPFVKIFGVSHWTEFNSLGSVTFFWLFLLFISVPPFEFKAKS